MLKEQRKQIIMLQKRIFLYIFFKLGVLLKYIICTNALMLVLISLNELFVFFK